MQALHALSQQPVFLAVEQALLGFLWQGAAVALVVAGLLALIPERSSRARYAVACLGLLAMAVLPAVSLFSSLVEAAHFVLAESVTPTATDATVSADATFMVMAVPAPVGGSLFLETLRPWLLPAWCCGVLLLSLRTLLAWAMTQRLSRHQTLEAASPWHDALTHALARMRMSTPVRLLASASVDVPMVIGLWRPLILVPASAMTGLSASQLEAILAHELAHIRRHDYLVNLLQAFVETLLFYHPAVWWLSHRIREEREHCADDLAVHCCGDAYLYARALAHIEQLRAAPLPQPALGAGGGSLLLRVRRLLVASEPQAPRRPWRLASGLGSAMLAVVLGTSQLPETARAEPAPSDSPASARPSSLEERILLGPPPAPRLLVAPASNRNPSPAPARVSRPPVRAMPKEPRAPGVKVRPPRSVPLLIPDTGAIVRTELPRVPYTLDAEPSAPAVVEVSAPVTELAAPVAVAVAPVLKPEATKPAVLDLGPGITPPRFVSGKRFHYRDLAYGLEGKLSSFPRGSVVTRCTITTEGTVTDCKQLQGLRGLEEGVIRTLSTWRYAPALLDGKPVAVRYVFDVWFSDQPGGGGVETADGQLASLTDGPTAPPAAGG